MTFRDIKNRRAIIYGLLFIVLVCAGVFLLPFYIPRKTPTVSASYDYHFNNIVSVFSLLIALLLFAVFLYKGNYKGEIKLRDMEELTPSSGLERMNFKCVLILFLVHSLVVLVFYLTNANYGYGESNYFLLRVDRLLLGQEPYKDFEYAYGVLLIFLPKIITDLFNFSTSVEGYFISLIILNAFGIYFLYYFINSFNLVKKKKQLIFFSIGLACIPFSLGMNYTLIRFVTPLVSILALNLVIKRFDRPSLKDQILNALATVGVCLVNFTISVEIGLAMMLAVAGYFLLSAIINKKTEHFVSLLLGCVLLGVLLFFLGERLSLILRVFAAGGNNWVIIPAPSILLFIIAFFIGNVMLCASILKKNVSFLNITFLVFNIIMLAGAFGRCDPGHIFWYGLCSMVIAWVFLGTIRSNYFKFYSVAFIAVFVIGMNLSGLYLYRMQLLLVVAKSLVHGGNIDLVKKIAEQFNYDTSKITRFATNYKESIDYNDLLKYSKIALPFDADREIYLFLFKKRLFSPEYYTGNFLNVYTPEQIAVKLKNLQDSNHKYMIIPENIINFNYHSDVEGEKKMISELFLYPYHYNKVRDSQKLYSPVYSYIKKNYKPLKFIKKGYLLIERTT